MDITDLLISLDVEIAQLLARGVLHRLLEVRVQTTPARGRLVADLVVLVEALGALGSVELLVEVGEGSGESRREAVLLVQGDRLLDRVVAHHVPVGEVLGDNAGAWLVLLGDVLFLLFGGRGGCLFPGEVVDVGGCLDVDGGAAQLGLVQEKCCFGGTEEDKIVLDLE